MGDTSPCQVVSACCQLFLELKIFATFFRETEFEDD
jgi:hypothetical protein